MKLFQHHYTIDRENLTLIINNETSPYLTYASKTITGKKSPDLPPPKTSYPYLTLANLPTLFTDSVPAFNAAVAIHGFDNFQPPKTAFHKVRKLTGILYGLNETDELPIYNPSEKDWHLTQVEISALNITLRYYNPTVEKFGRIILSTESFPPDRSRLNLRIGRAPLTTTPHDRPIQPCFRLFQVPPEPTEFYPSAHSPCLDITMYRTGRSLETIVRPHFIDLANATKADTSILTLSTRHPHYALVSINSD